MSVSIRDPRFTGVVGSVVEFERIATGCLFTEGPLWHPREHYLLWSDMPGDHLRRWSERDGVTTFRKPCSKSNGLTWDPQGRLLACEHASSQVTRTEPGGRITPVATHHDGKELNSPNDIVCAPDGMKIDSAGNVYCCGPGGIHVFSPDATLLEVLEIPEYPANFAWGGDDYRSLFVTASTSLYRTRRTIPGLPVF